MKPPPRCSVVIPTRDCLAYLGHAIASVRMQDMDDMEIIVIDDGSSDGTAQWLEQEAARDPRLVPLTLDGKGPSQARNHAISLAKGRFVAFLDADDLWWPGKLARQLAYHERRPGAAFSFTDYLHVDPEGGLRGTCFDYWKPAFVNRRAQDYAPVPDAELEILAANVVGTSTVVASLRSLQNANGFAAVSRSAEDWDLWLRLAKSGEAACSPAVTMTYLMRPTSVTQDRGSRIDSMRSIVAPYAGQRGAKARSAWRRACARIDIAEAERARLRGAPWTAARHHLRAFARKPDVRTARAGLSDIAAAMLPGGRPPC